MNENFEVELLKLGLPINIIKDLKDFVRNEQNLFSLADVLKPILAILLERYKKQIVDMASAQFEVAFGLALDEIVKILRK